MTPYVGLDDALRGADLTARFTKEELTAIEACEFTGPALTLGGLQVVYTLGRGWTNAGGPLVRVGVNSCPTLNRDRYKNQTKLGTWGFTRHTYLPVEPDGPVQAVLDKQKDNTQTRRRLEGQIEKVHARRIDAEAARDRVEVRFQKMALGMDVHGKELLESALTFLDSTDSGLSIDDLLEDIADSE